MGKQIKIKNKKGRLDVPGVLLSVVVRPNCSGAAQVRNDPEILQNLSNAGGWVCSYLGLGLIYPIPSDGLTNKGNGGTKAPSTSHQDMRGKVIISERTV